MRPTRPSRYLWSPAQLLRRALVAVVGAACGPTCGGLVTTGLLALMGLTAGCSTDAVTIESSPETAASLVPWSKLDSEGKSLGPMPVTITKEALSGNVVRLTAKGKEPVYWALESAADPDLKVHLDLPPAAECKTQEDSGAKNAAALSKAANNQLIRTVLKAYKALWQHDLAVTKKLAEQVQQMHPELAAAALLNGLASLEGGEREAARTAFTTAKSLDPEDSDIDDLLKLTQ